MLPGVSLARSGKRYKAQAYRGASYHLGTFDTEQEAHEAYIKFISSHPERKPGNYDRTSQINSKLQQKKEDSYANLQSAWYNL
jgi:hypothetical protein